MKRSLVFALECLFNSPSKIIVHTIKYEIVQMAFENTNCRQHSLHSFYILTGKEEKLESDFLLLSWTNLKIFLGWRTTISLHWDLEKDIWNTCSFKSFICEAFAQAISTMNIENLWRCSPEPREVGVGEWNVLSFRYTVVYCLIYDLGHSSFNGLMKPFTVVIRTVL